MVSSASEKRIDMNECQFNLFINAGFRVGQSMITLFRNSLDITQEEQDWNRYILIEYNSKEACCCHWPFQCTSVPLNLNREDSDDII